MGPISQYLAQKYTEIKPLEQRVQQRVHFTNPFRKELVNALPSLEICQMSPEWLLQIINPLIKAGKNILQVTINSKRKQI